MSTGLDQLRKAIATHNVISPVGAEIVAEKIGSYRGEAVRSTPENSRASQAARAVPPAGLQRTDFRTLHTRALRQGQGAHPRATARIADYHDKLPGLPQEARILALVDSFQSLAEMMAQAQQASQHRAVGGGVLPHSPVERPAAGDGQDEAGADAGEAAGEGLEGEIEGRIFRLLQDFDGDVTHQYAALDVMREHFAGKGDQPAFERALEKAAAVFGRGDLARDVRAGFAAANVATEAAPALDTSPAAIRDGYRALLREQPHLGVLFDRLAPFDLDRNFDAAIATFMEAAANDLRAVGTAPDRMFLHGLVTELGRLKKLRTLLHATADLIRQTERMLPPEWRGRLDSTRLTSDLLHFCARSTAALPEAQALLQPLEGAEPHGRVVFVNGLRHLHSQIPDEVMPGIPARLQQGQALLALLDELVPEEEEAFARTLH